LPNADKPIVTEPGDAVATLNSLVIEMENRYKLDTNRTSLSRYTRDRQLDLFARSRNQVGKLIDDCELFGDRDGKSL